MKTPDAWTRCLASSLIYWPVCLAGVVLVGLALYGPEAERRLAVEGQCTAMQTEVRALEQTRDQLAAAERALQNDPAYAEQVVRHEMGIVRAGETRLPLASKPKPAAPQAPAAGEAPPVLVTLSRFAEPQVRYTALVSGSALLMVGLVLSLPGRQRTETVKS